MKRLLFTLLALLLSASVSFAAGGTQYPFGDAQPTDMIPAQRPTIHPTSAAGRGHLIVQDILDLIGVNDVTDLFTGSGAYLRSDGTRGTPEGTDLIVSDVTDLFTGIGDFMMTDGSRVDLGTAAFVNTGTSIGTIPLIIDDGDGNATLPFTEIDDDAESGDAVTWSVDKIISEIAAGDQTAAEVDITDAGSYFTGTTVEAALQELGAGSGGTGLPQDCDDLEILVAIGEASGGWVCMQPEDHPFFALMMESLHSAGLNTISFDPINPASYPAYFDTDDVTIAFDLIGSHPTFEIDPESVECSLDEGTTWDLASDETTGFACAWTGEDSLVDGPYDLYVRGCDNKEGDPNCTPTGGLGPYVFHVDTAGLDVDLEAHDEPIDP